tara:strand:- start:135 stop:512 length:378 start_codon:yes stop_codon:yes gene_type:complete
MSEEKKDKGKKLDFDQRELTVDVAIYVMAIGAVLADGKVEEDELGAIGDIATMFNHIQHYEDATAYHEHFKDNESAMEGAIKVIKDSSDAAKVAAVAFMSYVLVQDGVNQAEDDFYQMVVSGLTS